MDQPADLVIDIGLRRLEIGREADAADQGQAMLAPVSSRPPKNRGRASTSSDLEQDRISLNQADP
jgi:hypothetical protein